MVKIGVDSLKISVCQDDVIFNFAAALCTPVKELLRFMLYRLEHQEHGVELYNCCFEPPYTIQHIVEAMKKVTGLIQFVPDIPNWVIMPMARTAMLLGSPMGICPARVKKLQISTNISGEK